MRLSQTYSMKLKRRKEGKTDYKKRLALLKSGKPWFVVRVKSNQVIAQVVSYQPNGDKARASATSLELRKLGWKKHCGNASSAYLTGFLCGNRALEKGVKECNLDIGLHTPVPGSNVFAVLKGAVDSGLKIPHDEKCFPGEGRIDAKAVEEIKPKIGKAKVVKWQREKAGTVEKTGKKKTGKGKKKS